MAFDQLAGFSEFVQNAVNPQRFRIQDNLVFHIQLAHGICLRFSTRIPLLPFPVREICILRDLAQPNADLAVSSKGVDPLERFIEHLLKILQAIHLLVSYKTPINRIRYTLYQKNEGAFAQYIPATVTVSNSLEFVDDSQLLS
ncbi:hypothetical protein BGX30_012609 [Mortierella sp. GBA39]|nr:hypothetical protein BGX30_012609 [Mortierella sp. GBA39]